MNKDDTIELTARVRNYEGQPRWLVPCEGCRHIRYVHVEQEDGTRSCWTGGAYGWCDCPEYVAPPHLQHARTP